MTPRRFTHVEARDAAEFAAVDVAAAVPGGAEVRSSVHRDGDTWIAQVVVQWPVAKVVQPGDRIRETGGRNGA